MTTADEQRERELKFDVPTDWAWSEPDWLARIGGSVRHETVHLETTYFDTSRYALQRDGLTLRRRVGGADSGWQLKVPDGDARIEIRVPLGGRGVPEPLRTATLGVRAGAALKPIAVLRTERDVHRLLDAAGRPLVEIVYDLVTSTEMLEFAVTRQWREVEAELVEGDEKLLRRVARWLTKQGATPARSASKLARALDIDEPVERTQHTLDGLIGSYLDRQHEAIVRGDIALRRGQDAVHATRVATRRYRSVLRIFAPVLFDAQPLESDLAWFGRCLGEVRDRQVLRTHLEHALAKLSPELIVGPVHDHIREALDDEQARAAAELERLMRSRRYFALLERLGQWRDDLPTAADAPAREAADYLSRAERTVRRRLRKVPDADRGGGDDRNDRLHRVRKAAKRARYVGELSRPELGKRARSAVKRLKKQQGRLGAAQDSVLAAEFLRRISTEVAAQGENTFTYGVLYERERGRSR